MMIGWWGRAKGALILIFISMSTADGGSTPESLKAQVTALAAGHRPCFECRRADAVHFLDCYARARGLDRRPSAPDFDRLLHAARLDGKRKRTQAVDIAGLPDGAMIMHEGEAWAMHAGMLLKWSFDGYVRTLQRPVTGTAELITPLPVVEALRFGYKPVFHPSAG